MKPMSPATLESAKSIADMAGILFTILAALSGLFILYFGSQLDGYKKKESAELQIKVSNATERAAKAESDLLRLQSNLSWRVLSKEQDEIIRSEFSSLADKGITLWIYIGQYGEETDRFGRQVVSAFEKTGIKMHSDTFNTDKPVQSGIKISYGTAQPAIIKNFIEGMIKSKLIVSESVGVDNSQPIKPGDFIITVWPKGVSPS